MCSNYEVYFISTSASVLDINKPSGRVFVSTSYYQLQVVKVLHKTFTVKNHVWVRFI